MEEFYRGKKILITGAVGTVGAELVRQLHKLNIGELRLMDNNETGMFFLMEEYKNDSAFCFLGDVRDRDKLEKLSNGVDIIFHCAAFKHVILSEYNPFDVVQTNIMGVENIIRAATANKVKYVLFTSSDKAVNPTNVMGTSKLMGEKLITAVNAVINSSKAIFASTRFGNVVGSRGSVVPLFMNQIKSGGPVTVTDKRMTRFIMTVEDAVKMVLQSLFLAKGGEVFVTKMPVVKIQDLAEVMIDILAPKYGYKSANIKITEIGAKPGEKLYEELMSDEESHRSVELGDVYVITPAFRSIYKSIQYEYEGLISDKIQKPYISSMEEPLSKEDLKLYLLEKRVFEKIEETSNRGQP
jgi:FlaA1/EpsC-like NDP-sugar epimerase